MISEPVHPSPPEELARARQLVVEHGWNATAYQILNPGIARWLSRRGDAVVGYVSAFGYRVVAGSPICAEERLAEVVEEFEQATHDLGLWSCWFAADERLARLLERRGPLDRILLGAQPAWRPARLVEIFEEKKSLRAQVHRAWNKGVRVKRWPSERADGDPRLARCLEEWLATRGLPPLHFLVEPETLGRLADRKVFVAEQRSGSGAEEVMGFLVASPIPTRRGWLVEQTIRGAGAPNGTSELLLASAVAEMAAEGAEYVTLGLSPLSRRAEIAPPQAWWIRALLAWMRAHGRRFYNFDGLDAYKAKFLPEHWEPIWAITSERCVGPGTLWAITEAFAKMSPLLLGVKAIARAGRREVEWIGRRFSILSWR